MRYTSTSSTWSLIAETVGSYFQFIHLTMSPLGYAVALKNVKSRTERLRLCAAYRLLARYERKQYADFSKINVVSKIDRDYLVGLAPKACVAILLIASGYPHVVCALYPGKRQSGAPIVTICGSLGDAAIAVGFAEFMRLVVPVVSGAYPGRRLRVLGRRISASLKRELKEHSQVEYFALLEHCKGFLSASEVLLLPDRAGAPGAKTHMVQAMALGRAVLGSTVAFEGFPIGNRRDGAVYSAYEGCRERLLLLLANSELRRELGAAAARLAADEYSPERIGPLYEAIFLQTVRCHASLKEN